jgi:transposase
MLGPPLSAPSVKLVPVRVAEARKTEPSVLAVRPKPDAKRPGPIEIELENGIRIRVDADVSQAALRRVVAALRG